VEKTNPLLSDMLALVQVLVVDDSRTLRRILIRELNKLGINKTLEAANGREALDVVQSTPIDLMLLDMEMTELDGLEVLKTMSNMNERPPFPVIVVSGADQIEKTIACIELGAEDYLPKPFDPVLLKARIFSSLEKKRLQDLETQQRQQLEAEKQRLEVAQMKTEQLLLNILPRSIAERLKRGEKNIAGHYPESTVLFSDIVGFTKMSAEISAADLVNLLNDLFTRFDKRAESLGLEKIKTIGDAYMAVGGLPIPRADHAEICADMALGMFEDLHAFNQQRGKALDLRIGLNSGPVVAGVIGYTKFSYDLWGNTVNTASRMESTSPPGRVQASPTTVELLKGHFELDWRPEPVDCKGLGLIQTALGGNRKR